MQEYGIAPYIDEFKDKYELNKETNWLLDNIEVYGLIETELGQMVPFDIIVNSENRYILPRCINKNYTSYVLKVNKLVPLRLYQSDQFWITKLSQE